MRIRGDKLAGLARGRGLGVEALAGAVARKGLDRERAVSAVRNWMRGSDHPRCKPEDIRNLATALGADVSELVRFTSIHRQHRGSPRKAALLVDMIRGKSYTDATRMLEFTPKRAAVDVHKALEAARSDAEQVVSKGEIDRLVVAESRVDEGPTMKRFQPKDRGRAHRILKRTSHITIGLEVGELETAGAAREGSK